MQFQSSQCFPQGLSSYRRISASILHISGHAADFDLWQVNQDGTRGFRFKRIMLALMLCVLPGVEGSNFLLGCVELLCVPRNPFLGCSEEIFVASMRIGRYSEWLFKIGDDSVGVINLMRMLLSEVLADAIRWSYLRE